MYGEILNGKITHYRGDTLSTPIYIYEGDRLSSTPYHLTENDKLYLGIMEPNQAFEDAIIKKVYTKDSPKDENGNILFELESSDTEFVLPGTYYYCVKLFRDVEDEEIITIIKPSLFWLLGNIPKKEPPTPLPEDNILDGGEITL